MKLTIYEIAKKAKVSIATVSRALNPEMRGRVRPDTLKRVDSVIARHQYAPSLAAKGLTQQVFRTVGVLVPHGKGLFLNDYYARILCGISDSLLDTPYRFKMLMLPCDDTRWDKYNFKSAEGIDGLIVTHWHAFFSGKTIFRNLEIPCVIIGDPEKNVHAHIVSGDQGEGGRLAAECLFEKGHRRIAVMAGSPCSTDNRLRVNGFSAFLKKKGVLIDKALTVCGDFQEEKGSLAAEELLKTKKKFSALFCANDAMARGALRTFKQRGLECPRDISVIGFDDEEVTAEMHPPLTTIRVPLYEVAKEAALTLTGYLKSRKAKGFFRSHTLLPAKLIERASVGRI